MLPRWLAVLGFVGLCTSFACFPPMSVAPVVRTDTPTGASPWPSGYVPPPSPSPSGTSGSPSPGAGTPSPGAAPAQAAAYFPVRAGLWRYRVATTPAGGAAVAGERTLELADVVASGDAKTATVTSTAKLNVPGFTGLDEAAVKGQAALTADRFALTLGGRTIAVPVTQPAGATWTENGLTARLATWSDGLTAPGLGRAFADVLRVEYLDPAAPTTPVTTLWFARDVGLLQRLDAFTHDGKAWEARAELTAHPAP